MYIPIALVFYLAVAQGNYFDHYRPRASYYDPPHDWQSYGPPGYGYADAHRQEYHAASKGKRRGFDYCRPGEDCWPKDWQFAALVKALDPSIPRSLVWGGPGTPQVAAIPATSDQPLFGEGASLAPAAKSTDDDSICFVDGYDTPFCRLTLRNNPLLGWKPSFVVWPTNISQIQIAVKFARKHRLCVSVAGSGHDYMNRHSCPHGVMIRTSLLKSVEWLDDYQAVRLGPGITTSEIHFHASPVNRSIVTSSTPSLTIGGWALGGGHGHLNPLHGLGSDQILAIELVDADGCLHIVNEHGTTKRHLDGRTEHSRNNDLLWAVRGGGAASWGVVASLTLKTHPIPAGGYASISMAASGNFCADGGEDFFKLLEEYFEWSLTLDKFWSGEVVLVPYAGAPGSCSLGWSINIFYLYHGASNVDLYATWHRFTKKIPESITPTVTFDSYSDLWDLFKGKPLETINPFPVFPPTPKTTGAIPSYMVSREAVRSKALVEVLRKRIGKCSTVNCEMYLIFQEISGNIGSPQRHDVPLSPGIREGLFMVFPILPTLEDLPDYEPLGEYAYYSLSAWNMKNWQHRYWGNHYKRLLEIKKAYDPEHYFSCHHCVGDEEKDY